MAIDSIKNKNIFITGGSGFIGSWLIDRLVSHNKIWCYDNGRRETPKIRELTRRKNLIMIKGDILDRDKLTKSIPRKLDIVLHLAAIAGVSSYYEMPLETMKVNLIGTYNLLEILKERPIDLFIDFSTSEVYGRFAKNVGEEDNTCQGPVSDLRWTYSVSKMAGERLSHCYHHKYGLPVVSIRPFNIYGPLQVGEGAIHIFVRNAVNNEDIFIDGNGSQVRAWCYIEDFIEGVMSCIKNRKDTVGKVFNLGNPGAAVNMTKLAKKIVEITGSRSKIRFRDNARTDIQYRVPDISRARKVLDFRPSVDLASGLKRTIDWYRENPA